MTQDELPPYEPWVDALLDAERKPRPLPSDVEARLLQRVLTAPIAALDEALGEDPGSAFDGLIDGPALSAPASATLPSAVAAKAALGTGLAASTKLLVAATGAAGLLLGAAAGVTGYAVLGPEKERVVTRVEVREVRVPIAVAPAPDASVNVPDAVEPPPPDAGPAPRTQASKRRNLTKFDSTPTRDTELADENALITRAQTALSRGRADEALEAALEHERSYPQGRFVEEREALAIQALVKRGDMPAARARAERFYRRYPQSLLTRLVRAVVKAP